VGSLVLRGCKKSAPSSQSAVSPSITSESQEAKEDRIKAKIQALLRNLGEGASDDPQLNLAAPITHMLVGEAEFKRLEKLAEESRLRFVKVAEKDMPLLYKLAQELNAVIKGHAYLNAFTLTTEDENGLPVYTVIINEKEFQKPPVELWITLIHQLFGRVAETEMSGKLASIEAEEARAYRKEAQVLDRVIRCNDSFIQYIQQAASSEEDLQLLRQVLDIETLIEKKNKAEQQAEYYQRKADAEPVIPGKVHSGDTLLISKGNRETRGNHTYFSVELMSPRVR
jgi:hypothetical protein